MDTRSNGAPARTRRRGDPVAPGSGLTWVPVAPLIGDNGAMTARRDVILLGSTGSIGTQALDVIVRNPDRFRVVGLAAGGGNVALLAEQAIAFDVPVVAVADAAAAPALEAELAALRPGRRAAPRSSPAREAATELAGRACDVVLNGMTGAVGLEPTLAALRAGHSLALANKESLIIGGPLVTAAAAPGQIVPVDSEHSALAQCLRRRARRRGPPARAHRQRGAVPGPHPRRAGRRHPRAGHGPPDLGRWARSSRSTPRRWSTRVSR